jgi:hypothetical protein
MSDDKATCRGCHRELRGSPYYTGKPAFIRPHVRALAHYFGGWVCSASCEVRVFKDMRDAGVWGSTEARLMASAHDRHAANH